MSFRRSGIPERQRAGGPPRRQGTGLSTAGNLAYRWVVSLAEQPSEPPRLTVVAPKDAVRQAKPMPSNAEMAIDGLTNEEWDAFERALADQ